jgi:hypothetical protein
MAITHSTPADASMSEAGKAAWNADHTGTWPAGDVSFTQSGSGAVAESVQTALRRIWFFDQFGATGDGTTDDTSDMQAALDALSTAGGGLIKTTFGKTYLVSFASSKTIDAVANRTCLGIPSNVIVHVVAGSTVKLAASQNATIFINKNAGTSQDSDLGLIVDGWLDGNETNQTSPAAGEMAMVKLYNVDRPYIPRLNCKNARDYFGRFLLCNDVLFTNFYGMTSDGDGWSFGVGGTNNIFGGFIDNIYAEACTQNYGSLQGNGVIGCIERAVVGKMKTVNCAGGIKIQSPSDGLTSYGQLTFIGGANGTTNSGIKVQGQSGQADGGIVSIGEIISELAEGEGLAITECTNVQIGSFKSAQDGQAGTNAALDISDTASNIQIGTVHIEEAGGAGADCDGDNVKLGSVIVKNSGDVTGNANFIVSANADGIYIGSLLSIDSQGTHTATRGLNLVSGCKNITIGEYHSRGDYSTPGDHLVDGGATNLRIGTYRIDDDALYVPLGGSGSAGNLAATATETDLLSQTIQARSLYATGKGYKIRAWGFTANNANPKTAKLYFGSGAILTTALTINQASVWEMEAMVVKSGSNTQAYISRLHQNGATAILDVERGDGSQTDTSDITVKVTATVTDAGGGINANDLAQRGLTIEPIL